MSNGTDLVVSVIYPPMTINGGTFLGSITVPNTILIDGAAASSRDLRYATAGSLRWIIRTDATAEGGASAGSDWQLLARDDTGAALFSNVITAKRSTGIVGINVAAASLTAGNQNQFQVGGGIISKGAGNLTGLATTDRTTATQVWTWYADAGVFRLFFTADVFQVEQSGKFGYPAGSSLGAAVTQLTSKATAVTINKATGDITLNAAALAAATIVSFVVNCTTVAAADLPLIQHVSGGTLGAYTVTAGSIVAGTSFTVYVRNNTAGSLSEALVLRFAIVKAAST